MQTFVASFTDAWIETTFTVIRYAFTVVASFTDAWIETFWHLNRIFEDKSHLLQMRGLKQKIGDQNQANVESHLLQMRGLKLTDLMQLEQCEECRIFYRCVD